MRAALLLVPLLLLPAAFAATPAGMTLSGTLSVNGRAALPGTPIQVWSAEGALANGSVGAGGAFEIVVPAEDPETPAHDGAAEGDALELRALGGRAIGSSVTFQAASSRAGLAFALSLPDLAVGSAAVSPQGAREGENLTVTGNVINRGERAASLARVVVSEGGRVLAQTIVPEVPVNASRAFGVSLSSANLGGNRTLSVAVVAAEGDADPSNDLTTAAVSVVENRAPLVAQLARLPVAPADNETVTLTLEASDEDGIRRVTFRWNVSVEQVATVASPPYAATIGAFPAGTIVRYYAEVEDAGPLARTTRTPVQAFEVRDANATAPSVTPSVEPATPSAGEPESPPAGVPAPWPALVAGALACAAYLRRRT